MPVREPFMIKRVSSGDLTLDAVAESLVIKDIKVINPQWLKDYVKVEIKNTIVNVIPNYLLIPTVYGSTDLNIFRYIKEKHPEFSEYKILDGEQFKLVNSGGFSFTEVVYETHDPNDIKAGDIGTRFSNTKNFIVTGYNDTTITTTGWYKITAIIEPETSPDYPFNDRIPASKQIEIVGIACALDIRGSTKAVYLRIWNEEKVLFDEDRNGFLIDPTVNNTLGVFETYSGYNTTHYSLNFFRFDSPLIMRPQEKYTFEVYVEYDGTNALQPKDVMITLVGVEKPAK